MVGNNNITIYAMHIKELYNMVERPTPSYGTQWSQKCEIPVFSHGTWDFGEERIPHDRNRKFKFKS
jgi:hypothetical protein